MILNKLLILFVTCQATEEVFVVLFKCKPFLKSFYPEMEGTCINLIPLWWTTVSNLHRRQRANSCLFETRHN